MPKTSLLLLVIISITASCRFNQHSYTQKVLHVTSNKARLKGKNLNKKLHKGDVLINLGKKDGKYHARITIIKYYGGPSVSSGTKSYTGWIDAKYVKEELANEDVYSKKVVRKKLVVFKDPRIGFVPGTIKLCGKSYPVGQGFPLISKGPEVISFKLPDGKICSVKNKPLFPKVAYARNDPGFYITDANWDTEKNQPTLQEPIPNLFFQFIYGTIVTNWTYFFILLVFLIGARALFNYAFKEHWGLAGYKTLLFIFFFTAMFESCGYNMHLSGIKNSIFNDVTFGKGVYKFFNVFYIPFLFVLIGLVSAGLIKTPLLIAAQRSLLRKGKTIRNKREGERAMDKKVEVLPPANMEDFTEEKIQQVEKDLTSLKGDLAGLEKYFGGLFGGIKAEAYRRNRERLAKVIGADVKLLDEIYKKRELLGKLKTQKAKIDLEIKEVEGELGTKDLEQDLKKEKLLDELEEVRERRERRKAPKDREDYDI